MCVGACIPKVENLVAKERYRIYTLSELIRVVGREQELSSASSHPSGEQISFLAYNTRQVKTRENGLHTVLRQLRYKRGAGQVSAQWISHSVRGSKRVAKNRSLRLHLFGSRREINLAPQTVRRLRQWDSVIRTELLLLLPIISWPRRERTNPGHLKRVAL